MKRKTILKRLRQAAAERKICNIWHDDNGPRANGWPLLVSDKLVVCALDTDFQLNGYVVYAIDHLRRVVIKEDRCAEISRREGLLEQLVVPAVAYDSWQAFCASLPAEKLVGVEWLDAPEDKATFVVGRVVKAGKKRLHILYLDADACWQDAPWKIRYDEINELVYDDRYLNVFAKYVGEPLQGEAALQHDADDADAGGEDA